MKYEKKNLLVVAAAGMLSLVMVSGCGPKETTGKPGDTTTTTNTTPSTTPNNDPIDPATKDAYKFEKVAIPALADFKNLAVSGDKKVYVTATAGRALLMADGADAANLSDPAKWTPIALGEITGFDGTTAGKAKLTTANMVIGTKATSKGALIARAAGATNPDNGVGYLEGTEWKAAWNNSTQNHVAFGGVGSGDDYNAQLVAPAVLTKGTEEYPALYKNKYNYFVMGTPLSAPGKLDKWLVSKTRTALLGGDVKFTAPAFVAMVGEDALIVDPAYEIRLLPKAKIGPVTGDSVGTENLTAPTSAWNLHGAANTDISSVLGAGNKLYVALRSAKGANAAKTGGVIAYNFTSGATPKLEMVKTAKSWVNTSVVALAEHGTDVYAVTPAGLIKVNEDGSKGEALKATDLPANINDAKFVGDVLVVASATELSKGVVTK